MVSLVKRESAQEGDHITMLDGYRESEKYTVLWFVGHLSSSAKFLNELYGLSGL